MEFGGIFILDDRADRGRGPRRRRVRRWRCGCAANSSIREEDEVEGERGRPSAGLSTLEVEERAAGSFRRHTLERARHRAGLWTARTSRASSAAPRRGDRPVVEQLAARAFTVPTDAPEADGTFSWDATTVVLVEARAGGTRASATATPQARPRRWCRSCSPTRSWERTRSRRRRRGSGCAARCATSAIRESPRARSRRSTSRCGT